MGEKCNEVLNETAERDAMSVSSDSEQADDLSGTDSLSTSAAEGAEDAGADGEAVSADDEDAEELTPTLVLGDNDERDPALHETIIDGETAWQGRVIRVEDLRVEIPNGALKHRDIVRHPGGVGIVALTDSGKIALVRQYRTALDRVTVEIPAGKLEPGEDPLEAAKRELREETGFEAGRIAYLTSIAPSPGYTDEIIRIYFATHLTFVGANPDDDEFINVDLVDVNELIDAVLDGKIEDAKTVVGALACDAMAHRL